MHYKAVLSFALLGSSTAQSLTSRSQYAQLHALATENQYATLSPHDIATLVTIKTSLRHGTEQVNVVNNAIKGITAANAKTQLATVGSGLQKLSSDVSADMKKLKASGTIGIGEILGLLQEAPRNELIKDIMDLVVAFNGTFTEMGNKRDLVKGKQDLVDVVAPGIKSMKQGLLDIVGVVPSQVPAIAKGAIDGIVNAIVSKGAPKGAEGAAPAPAPEPAPEAAKGKGKGKGAAAPKAGSGVTLASLLTSPESQAAMGKGLDGVLDMVVNYLRGTVDTIIPAELLTAVFPTGPPAGFPIALVGAPKAASGASSAPSEGSPMAAPASAPEPAPEPAPAPEPSPEPAAAAAPAPKAAPKSPKSPKASGAPKSGAPKSGAPKGKGAPKGAKSSVIDN